MKVCYRRCAPTILLRQHQSSAALTRRGRVAFGLLAAIRSGPNMSLLATFDVKGWCPGALRPMESGDGLIARVRPWCGAFSLGQMRGLAAIAEYLGNGHIDLTRRGNLQIRGLSEDGLPELHNALDCLGLLD